MTSYVLRESWSVETLDTDERWLHTSGPASEEAARRRGNSVWASGAGRGVRLLCTTRTVVGERRRA